MMRERICLWLITGGAGVCVIALAALVFLALMRPEGLQALEGVLPHIIAFCLVYQLVALLLIGQFRKLSVMRRFKPLADVLGLDLERALLRGSPESQGMYNGRNVICSLKPQSWLGLKTRLTIEMELLRAPQQKAPRKVTLNTRRIGSRVCYRCWVGLFKGFSRTEFVEILNELSHASELVEQGKDPMEEGKDPIRWKRTY